MNVAVEVGEDRHPRLRLDAGDEARPAARHDHVEVAVEAGEHGAHGGAVARRHQADRRLGQAGGAQARHQAPVDQRGGAEALRTAAEHGGIAALEAQRAGIRRDARPALENDADDAERDSDALDAQAVGALDGRQHPADRIGQRGDGVEPGGERRDAALVEGKAVGEGAAAPSLGEVLGVGREDGGSGVAQARCGNAQRLGPGGVRRKRQRAAGSARLAPQRLHERADIGGRALPWFQLLHGSGTIFDSR